jgi:hypothetical protein
MSWIQRPGTDGVRHYRRLACSGKTTVFNSPPRDGGDGWFRRPHRQHRCGQGPRRAPHPPDRGLPAAPRGPLRTSPTSTCRPGGRSRGRAARDIPADQPARSRNADALLHVCAPRG